MNPLKTVSAVFVPALALLMAALALPALAQNFPTKPLRLIIPYGPLGAVDFVPRLLAERMGADLGQPIVIRY